MSIPACPADGGRSDGTAHYVLSMTKNNALWGRRCGRYVLLLGIAVSLAMADGASWVGRTLSYFFY